MIQPGYRIEHYVIIEKIGQGGQATVWSAHDEHLKRTVAVKTMRIPGPGEETSTIQGSTNSVTSPERFREEAQIIAALEHPNILPVYGFGQDDEMLYIIMRYMPAGSLKDLLRHNPLKLEEAIPLLEPLAGALDLAHQHRIIHRDLKSANILLDAQQHPYLADFGLSRTIGADTSEGGGTLTYMSPEQITGNPLDHRSDLYAFGIMIYELLAGHTPRINGQPWNIQQVMAGAELPLSNSIPAAVADVLKKATAVNPNDRFNTASDIVAALRQTTTAQSAPTQALPIAMPASDPAMQAFQEAFALLTRAQDRWADGAGRFHLEDGDFKYIASFYDNPDVWDITLDGPTRRLMLRAALEHGYGVEKWWEHVPTVADRRAVTLQTVTSDYPPARMRAMQRLAMLEDSSPPAIPIRVANVISAEPESEVKLAGIDVLEKRAGSASEWREYAFEEYIDNVLVALAIDDLDPRVAEAAARACGRIRSAYAVRRMAVRANLGHRQAFRALMAAREEVPSLPSDISLALRARVFGALSLRQLFDQPLAVIGRYVSAALGFAIGLGTIVYAVFNSSNGLLAAQQMGTVMAVGVLYGVLMGIGITAAVEIADRLKVWRRWARIALAWVIGAILCGLAFLAFHAYFYFTGNGNWLKLFQDTDWPRFILFVGIFVAGFAIASGWTRRLWLRSFAGTAGVLLAVYFSWHDGVDPLLYLTDRDDISLLLSLWLAMMLGVLTFLLPAGFAYLARLERRSNDQERIT